MGPRRLRLREWDRIERALVENVCNFHVMIDDDDTFIHFQQMASRFLVGITENIDIDIGTLYIALSSPQNSYIIDQSTESILAPDKLLTQQSLSTRAVLLRWRINSSHLRILPIGTLNHLPSPPKGRRGLP